MQKSTTVQLTRDDHQYNRYTIYKKGAELTFEERGYWLCEDVHDYLISFCAKMLKSFLPSSLHLPPGGGPVDITIVIKDSK